MKMTLALTIFSLGFSASISQAEVQSEDEKSPAYYVLSYLEISPFTVKRKDQYLKEMHKVLQGNKQLPRIDLADLKAKADTASEWDEFEAKVVSACESSDAPTTLKKACERLMDLRVDTLTSESAGKPEPKKEKTRN